MSEPLSLAASRGSVLGPVLFIIYSNGVDFGLDLVSKFADDTNIGKLVLADRDRQNLEMIWA